MRFLGTLRLSVRILLGYRTRSLLAVLAVAIGVALVLVTGALADGARTELLSGMEGMGTRVLVVRPAPVKKLVARREVQGSVTSLRMEDSTAMTELSMVSAVAPALDGTLVAKANAGTTKVKVMGTTPALLKVKDFAVNEGRFFDEEEDGSGARLAVLGAQVQATLFPTGNPIGQTIRLRGVPFEVIGTLRPKGASADGADQDNQILIPIHTAFRRVYDSRSLTLIFVAVREPGLLDAGEDGIRRILRRAHRLDSQDRPDDFAIQHQARTWRVRQELARSLALARAALRVITLVVGGAGVLGLMLLSVQERTTEIGLRMAVGARRRDIGLQFLTEALLLGLGGGTVGVALGVLGVWAVIIGTDWRVHVSPAAVSVSLGTALAIGLTSGVFPARRAARVPPVQAISQKC